MSFYSSRSARRWLFVILTVAATTLSYGSPKQTYTTCRSYEELLKLQDPIVPKSFA